MTTPALRYLSRGTIIVETLDETRFFAEAKSRREQCFAAYKSFKQFNRCALEEI